MRSPIAVRLGAGLALLALAGAVFSGWGCDVGFWHFRAGIALFAASVFAAFAAFSLCAFCILRKLDGKFFAIFGLIVSSIVAGTGIYWYWRNSTFPAIHDISTDTERPPQFVSLLETRKTSANGHEYGGPEVAEAQKKAYPDIRTLEIPMTMEPAFHRAVDSAKKMGWQVVDANLFDGRIEAIATTFWFRMKSDVTIRLRPAKEGTRIDVRSVSRSGKSDHGTNARRIRQYFSIIKTGRK